jgi:hypothetical protein
MRILRSSDEQDEIYAGALSIGIRVRILLGRTHWNLGSDRNETGIIVRFPI